MENDYIIRHSATISTAITALQLKAGSNRGFFLLEAFITQRGSTTSAQEVAAIVRKTGAATVTLGAVGTHVFKTDPNQGNPDLSLGTSATGVIASGEGTDGDICYREGFNVLNGWRYVPVPESRIWVPVGGIIGLKFTTAPASQSWEFGAIIREV